MPVECDPKQVYVLVRGLSVEELLHLHDLILLLEPQPLLDVFYVFLQPLVEFPLLLVLQLGLALGGEAPGDLALADQALDELLFVQDARHVDLAVDVFLQAHHFLKFVAHRLLVLCFVLLLELCELGVGAEIAGDLLRREQLLVPAALLAWNLADLVQVPLLYLDVFLSFQGGVARVLEDRRSFGLSEEVDILECCQLLLFALLPEVLLVKVIVFN